jgi:ribonuclease BN (tRNA processing enzyme)
VLGLPGLLLSLQVNAKAVVTSPITVAKKEKEKQQQQKQQQQQQRWQNEADEMRVLHIYGPEGLYELVATVLRLIHADLNFLRIEVHELVRGMSRSAGGGGGGGGRSVVLAKSLRRNLIRRAVPQNPDGTWTLQTPVEITTPEEAESLPSSGRGVYVMAAEVYHLSKLTCLGYVIREPHTRPRLIDQSKAGKAGVQPGKKYNQLKYGFSVPSDVDPLIVVHPDQVLIGDPRPSRSVAILGDCCAVPEPMLALCQNVDVLVHEATLAEANEYRPGLAEKVWRTGHSTAAMAGVVARRVQPKVLLLNHIPSALRLKVLERGLAMEAARQLVASRSTSNHSTRPLSLSWPPTTTPSPTATSTSTTPVSPATTRVQVGYDHLEIMVPAEGFPW